MHGGTACHPLSVPGADGTCHLSFCRAIKNGKGLHSKKEVPIHRVADISGVRTLPSQITFPLGFLLSAGSSHPLPCAWVAVGCVWLRAGLQEHPQGLRFQLEVALVSCVWCPTLRMVPGVLGGAGALSGGHHHAPAASSTSPLLP